MKEIDRNKIGTGPNQAKQRGEPRQGVDDAIRHANEVFNSVEKRNERGKSADGKQYERDKKALELRKEQALANLHLQKRGLTKAQYDFARSGIENYYLQQESIETERYENHKLARKEKYQQDLADQANKDAGTAAKELPNTRREFDAQMNALSEGADRLGDTEGGGVDDHDARTVAIKGTWTDGRNRSDAKSRGEQAEMGKVVTDKPAPDLREVEHRTAAREQKQSRQKAAKEAGEATTVYDALYSRGGDVDQRRDDSQFRQFATQQKIQINLTKALAEATEHGTQIAQGLDALHRANVNNFNLVIAKLKQQAAEMEALRRQLNQNRSQVQALPSQQY